MDKLPPRPIKAGMSVGARAALRASYNDKCVCRTCVYLLTSCEGVTVSKGLRHGTPREVEALKEKETSDASTSL
jgi:hypothetical protein